MTMSNACDQVEARLAELVEGGPLTPELDRHLDRCDSCAALLARAARTGRSLASLGDDFVLPLDLVDRVIAAAEPTRGARRDGPARPGWLPGLTRAVQAAWAAPLGRGALLAAGLAVGVGLLVAGLPARQAAPARPPSVAASAVVVSVEGLAGHAALLERRSEARKTWLPVGPGQRLEPGDRLRTGVHTRARLGLGATVVLVNRGTELEVKGVNDLELHRGDALADVSRRPEEPRFALHVPTGRVEVLGTRLHVSADEELALVDVVRGRVRLSGPNGALLIDAGQEGVLPRRGAPRAGAAPDLGRTLAWTEPAAEEGDGRAEAAPAGLGSLTAHRPGREGEKQALRLREHRVEASVQGFLARTEITETFENPTSHTLEGVYRFPLPGGARISRLALWVDGRLEEGTIVERDRATKIWRGVLRQATPRPLRKQKEEFVWVPGPWRDPALLEWRQGNQFELRIFPIPARGSRTVVLAYTEALPRTPRGRRYVYPLAHGRAGETAAGLFSFELALAGHDPRGSIRAPFYALERRSEGKRERLAYRAARFVPAGDVVVDFATVEADAPLSVHTYRGEGDSEPGYALFSLRPTLPPYRSDRPRSLCFVVDRSYSTVGEAARRQRMLLSEILAEVDLRDEVVLLACDSSCRLLGDWRPPSAATVDLMLRALDGVSPGGATDLGEALRAAGELLARRPASVRPGRVIYLGDGVATVGEIEPGRLLALARRHLGTGARLTTVGIGTAVDEKMLRALARAGGGRYVAYAPGSTARGQALQVMAGQYGATLDEAALELPAGLTRMAPRQPATVHEGEELLFAARLEGRAKGELILRGRVNGEPFRATFPLDVTAGAHAGNAFVPRAWAQLFIDQLDERGEESGGPSPIAEIVELSKRHHLLSRHTSLLVLESEAMRRAFGVTRGRLTEDWTGESQAAEGNQAEPRPGTGHGARAAEAVRRVVLPRDSTDPLAGLGHARIEAEGFGGPGAVDDRSGGGRSAKKELDDLIDGAISGGGASRPRASAGTRPRGDVQAGVVRGALDREAIRRVVRQNMGSIRAAFERRLRTDPSGNTGTVVVTFTIGPTGAVQRAQAGRGTDPALARALESAVSRWRFPQPKGGGTVTVSYPFVFRTAVDGVTLPGLRSPPPLDGRRWMRMRRVTVTEAEVEPLIAPTAADLRLVDERRRSLEERPDSRDRHRLLLEAFGRAGVAEEALRMARAWLSREPTSAEALRVAADAAARLGDREEALRLLSSILELDPRDTRLHARLAELHAGLGAPRLACAHRLTLSSLQPAEPRAAGDAASCREGTLRATPHRRSGRYALRARWSGGEDLDLALVDARGRRLAWLGAARGADGDHLASTSQEELSLRWLAKGRYRVELVRAGGAASTDPVRGSVEVSALDEHRTIPFRLTAGRAYVAELRVSRRTELVPAP